MERRIEYVGRNVFDGRLFAQKYYYHWTDEEFCLPSVIKQFLKPFDFGIRDKGFDYSVSAFIKDCDVEKLSLLIDYGASECNLKIDKDSFLESFLAIADLSSDSHYDPIVSFKFNNKLITGMSFYVTALKDKSLMPIYIDAVKRTLSLKELPTISNLITDCVHSHAADMFQVAWDFGIRLQNQNKIYLKIKNLQSFSERIKLKYPYLLDYNNIEGFRFCELAFVIECGILKMFNLYFKPL